MKEEEKIEAGEKIILEGGKIVLAGGKIILARFSECIFRQEN